MTWKPTRGLEIACDVVEQFKDELDEDNRSLVLHPVYISRLISLIADAIDRQTVPLLNEREATKIITPSNGRVVPLVKLDSPPVDPVTTKSTSPAPKKKRGRPKKAPKKPTTITEAKEIPHA